MSIGSTAVSDGSAISYRGQTSFFAITMKECFVFDKTANGPNSAISLTQTFDRISFYVSDSLYLEVQKEKKRGSGNNRVYRNLNSFLVSSKYCF